MQAVQGKSPLAWVGGKSQLAERIIARMPEHQAYCEVFAGAAWVLFKKPESRVEIINDINGELVTLYRVVKHHLPELLAHCRWLLVARDEWDRFMNTPANTLTDIQRAVRFYYLAKSAFGAKIKGQTWGVAASGGPRLNLARMEDDLADAHARLARVFIENKPYEEVLSRFDKPSTLFYLDPPYWGCESYYGEGIFSRDDFAKLATQLEKLKGKCIVSLNDTPGVREVFANFKIESVKTRYTLSAKTSKVVGEVLIPNF